jgi:uncharacterized protein with NRDE domain
MCLIAWNWQPDSATPLLLLANRDEFYARPALPMHWWDGGQVLAGRDLQAGGTWLGVSRSGRLAALTNYRLPVNEASTKPSRGALVADFLHGNMDARSYLEALARHAEDYNPFNLLVCDGKHFLGLESRHKRVVEIRSGLGAVSNADFDTPWPKLVRLKAGLQTQLLNGRLEVADLLPLLQDKIMPVDTALPRTGVPLELERMLSPAFVSSQHYGTRACSILTLNRRQTHFFEQSCNEHGMLTQTQQFFTPIIFGSGFH